MDESISKTFCDVNVYDDHVTGNEAQDIFENESKSVGPNKKKR